MRTRTPLLGLAGLAALALSLAACSAEAPAPEAAAPQETAPEAPPLRIQVVDGAGRPVSRAALRTRFGGEAPPPDTAGAWDEATATLTLPAGTRLEALLALAPGFRLARAVDVAGDLAIRLVPGIRLRVDVDLEGAPPADPLRLVLRLRPAPSDEGGPRDVPSDLLVEGVGRAESSGDQDLALPRGTFGYAVAAEDAARGLLLPAPGAWDLRWGLFDRTAGAWFSLDDAAVRVLVEDRPEPQAAGVVVSAAALEETLVGLRQRVGEMRPAR